VYLSLFKFCPREYFTVCYMFRKVLMNIICFGTAEVTVREISFHMFTIRCPPVDLAVKRSQVANLSS